MLSAQRKATSIVLAGSVAIASAVGIVGLQAHAPDGSSIIAQAQAATTKAGWYGAKSKPVTGQPGIKSIKLSGSKMKVKTSNGLSYGKSKANRKQLSKKTYTFKLSSKAKYYSTSSKFGDERLSAADGKIRLKSVGGYALNWKVKNGKVVRVEFFGK